MTKFIKAIKGNVSAGGRLFSEGVVTSVTDELGSCAEITQMEKLGYLKIFDTQSEAVTFSFVGVATLARSGQPLVPPVAPVDLPVPIKASEAKALAEASAKPSPSVVLSPKLTAAAAKAKAVPEVVAEPIVLTATTTVSTAPATPAD